MTYRERGCAPPAETREAGRAGAKATSELLSGERNEAGGGVPAVPGLARSACKPILEKLSAAHASTRGETIQEPDVPALARGIAGPGKPLACAVVSTLLLGLSRIGLESLERALERTP